MLHLRSYFLFIIISSCLIPFNYTVFPQNAPVQWGEIPLEDLAMVSFPQDTNASALILYERGETSINNDLELEMIVHARIKILTQNGYDFGTRSIVLNTDSERIYDIEAVTYNLSSEGKLEKISLQSGDIFKEKVTDYRTRYRFTLPNLQPGCVIEYKYRIISESIGLVRDWSFQTTEPVRWSEYILRAPKAIAYATLATGFEQWAVSEREDVPQYFDGLTASYLNNKIATCNQYRYAVKNAPALRDEPFVTNIDDYVNKVRVQLVGYAFPGGGKKEFLNTWESVIEQLLDDNDFYEMIDITSNIRKIVDREITGLTTPEDKFKAIYNWITKSIFYTDVNRIFCSGDSDDILELKKGNNADITFLLLSMLKYAGIDGDPVILSTRSNGQIIDAYPIVSQFNYVLARVNLNGNYHFVDATDPYRDYDLLPTKVLNVRGLIIKEGPPEWVTIKTEKVISEKSLTNLTVDEFGFVTANIEVQYSDYNSLNIKHNLENKSDLDLVKELLDVDALGFTIDSLKVSGKDDIHSPIKLNVYLTSSTYAQPTGDLIYLDPLILKTVTDNPFKSLRRKFPIDYSYLRNKTTVCIINFPDNYELKDNIQNKKTNVRKSVSYSKAAALNGTQIQFICKMDISEQTIQPQLYEQLRSFYNQIINSESEVIVIGLKQSEPGSDE